MRAVPRNTPAEARSQAGDVDVPYRFIMPEEQ